MRLCLRMCIADSTLREVAELWVLVAQDSTKLLIYGRDPLVLGLSSDDPPRGRAQDCEVAGR